MAELALGLLRNAVAGSAAAFRCRRRLHPFGRAGDKVQAGGAAGRLIEKVGRVTSLQVPHRLADAILPGGEVDRGKFRKSERGKALNTAVLGYRPVAYWARPGQTDPWVSGGRCECVG
jgi:hypothetical protein